MAINTLITIREALLAFVEGHGQLKAMFWDADDQRAPLITQSDEFPVLFVAPIDVNVGRAMNVHTLRVYVYERINDDRTDVIENANDTSLILRDIRVWWNSYGVDEIEIVEDPIGTFVSDRELDNLVGYFSDIKFSIPSHGRCQVPVSVVPVPPSGGCLDGTVVNSNDTYSQNVPSGETVVLPDTTYDIYLDGVFEEAVSLPTLSDESINISTGTFVPAPPTIQEPEEWTEQYYQDVYNATMGAYTRPSDWLQIDNLVSDTEQKIVMLCAVFNNDSNFIAFNCFTSSGQYRVNWGDGVETLHNSGVAAEYKFNYASHTGTETSRGYRQTIVTITAVSGNLTNYSANVKHSQSGLQNGYAEGYLDVLASGEFFTSITLSNNVTSRSVYLEKFVFLGTCNFTSCVNMFINCVSLRFVSLFNTSSCTSMQSMFQLCSELETIPKFNTTNINNFTSAFNGCYSLKTIPSLDFSSATTMQNIFLNAYSLRLLPSLNAPLAQNWTSAFSSNLVLQKVPSLNLSSATTLQNAFLSCLSINHIPSITLPSTVTSVSSAFSGCYGINYVNESDWNATSSAIDYTNIFNNCQSLASIKINGIKNTFSIANSKLSAEALNDLFTRLSVVTGKTITITGNWGASDGATNRSIATAKGWTVVG